MYMSTSDLRGMDEWVTGQDFPGSRVHVPMTVSHFQQVPGWTPESSSLLIFPV